MIETLRRLGPARLAAMAVVTAGLIAFFLFLVSRLTTPDMALLYGDLDAGDSNRIVQKLEQLGVAYELGGDGTTIRVPADQVLKLRLQVAEEGLPSGGTIGYEIFDRDQPLGTTSFEQQVNRLRALEGELARTIRMIQQVRTARVHLVIPERQLFAAEQPQPTASIILTMNGGGVLDKSQVVAIQHLVAAAVPGLKTDEVSVIDAAGNLLAGGGGDDDALGEASDGDEMRLAYENRMRRSIEELLQRSLGYGKIRAEVTADLDFDRVTTNSETFDPNGQVVRSTQTVEETGSSTDAEADGQVTVANNLPNPNAAQPGQGTSTSSNSRTEETVNYEISKQTEVHIQQSGQVKRLSVAVLVDGTYTTAEDGTSTYAPRSAEELDQIAKLVKSAIGFDESRGDSVEVVNMRFAEPIEAGADEGAGLLMGFTRGDVVRMIEIGVLGLLGVLALLFGVRPILRGIAAVTPAPMIPQLAGPAGAAQLPPGDASGQMMAAAENGEDGRALSTDIDRMIDVNQIEGRVRASSLKKVGELVQNHPDEAVNIMRSWMYQNQ